MEMGRKNQQKEKENEIGNKESRNDSGQWELMKRKSLSTFRGFLRGLLKTHGGGCCRSLAQD